MSRYYTGGSSPVHAVENVTAEIGTGEFVALSGPSGCGKTTLLHLLAGIDRPDTGEVVVDGMNVAKASERELNEFRRRRLGIVFQFFNLLPTMTVHENVSFPMLLDGKPCAEADIRARELIERVGLTMRASHFPHQLSGGEQQRAAIARALMNRPALLLADEPTGNLDSAASASVLEIFDEIARDKLTTLIIVTHSEDVARRAARHLAMRDGRLASDSAAELALHA